MTTVVTTFESAARSFADLVHRIPDDRWTGPGLGDWDLRSLVGHASRSLVTVSTYLQTAAEHEDVATPQDYYAQIADYMTEAGAEAIIERGRQAGRDLGQDPTARVDALVKQVMTELQTAGDPLIAVIGGLGLDCTRTCRPVPSSSRCTGWISHGRAGFRSTCPPRCSRRPRCWRRGSRC